MELSGLRGQLKAALAEGAPAPETGQPGVRELAERIKTIRAANTVEAAPPRQLKRRNAGEQPVTARIRRESQALTVPDRPVADTEASSTPPEAAVLSADANGLGDPKPAVRAKVEEMLYNRNRMRYTDSPTSMEARMSAKRKTAERMDETPVESAAAISPQREPGDEPPEETSRWQDPRGRHTIDLGDGRKLRFFRSERFRQARIEFLAPEGVDPKPKREDGDTQWLTDHGWKFRDQEKAWTRQLAKNTPEDRHARGNTDRLTQADFVTLANRIRERNGKEPIDYSFGEELAR